MSNFEDGPGVRLIASSSKDFGSYVWGSSAEGRQTTVGHYRTGTSERGIPDVRGARKATWLELHCAGGARLVDDAGDDDGEAGGADCKADDFLEFHAFMVPSGAASQVCES